MEREKNRKEKVDAHSLISNISKKICLIVKSRLDILLSHI